jgi:DNA polymerase-1
MILVRTSRPDKLKRFMAEAGLGEDRVRWGGEETPDVCCIVTVGGHGSDHIHTYVQQHYKVPLINCVDPETVWEEPTNSVYIILALQKAKMLDEGVEPTSVRPAQVKIADKIADVERWVYRHHEWISIDIESNQKTSEITCIAFANEKEALVVPLDREGASYWSPEDEAKVWLFIARLLGSGCKKVFQNFIFDTMMLSRMGVHTAGPIYDTMIAAHLIQPELPKGLKDLGRLYLMCDSWKDIKGYLSNETLWQYNARDAIYTAQILTKQLAMLQTVKRNTLFSDLLVPLSEEVLRICERGVCVDHSALQEMSEALRLEVEELERSLIETCPLPPTVRYVERKGKPRAGAEYAIKAGFEFYPYPVPSDVKKLGKLAAPVYEKLVKTRSFNPNSPYDVKEAILMLGFAVPTKKKKETTDKLALKKLYYRTKHPFFGKLLEYRTKSKMYGTYCKIKLDPDGRLRFSVNVAGTVEARFSSSKTPWDTGANIQNIPKKFRKIIVPSSKDWTIVNMDFKQADPHVVAWLAGADNMLEIMDRGGDLHAYTASAIVGRDITRDVGYDKDNSQERKLGKACNNALNYGMGAETFVQTVFKDLGREITNAEASTAVAAYFKLYPTIKKWHVQTQATLAKARYLETPFGRERYFYEPVGGPYGYKVLMEALAWIPPSTVADALNTGWLAFLLKARWLRFNSLIQCHDSLTIECHKDDLDKVAQLLLDCMEGVTFACGGKLRHFDADISSGPTWGDQTPWKRS